MHLQSLELTELDHDVSKMHKTRKSIEIPSKHTDIHIINLVLHKYSLEGKY